MTNITYKHPPNHSQTVLLNGDQVFKHLSLYGSFSFKPAQQVSSNSQVDTDNDHTSIFSLKTQDPWVYSRTRPLTFLKLNSLEGKMQLIPYIPFHAVQAPSRCTFFQHTMIPTDLLWFLGLCLNSSHQDSREIFQLKENYFSCFSFVLLEQTAKLFCSHHVGSRAKSLCQADTLSKLKVNKIHSATLMCSNSKPQHQSLKVPRSAHLIKHRRCFHLFVHFFLPDCGCNVTSCFKLLLPWLLHSPTGKQTLSPLGIKKEKKRRKSKKEKEKKENLAQNFPLPVRLKEHRTEAGGHKNICMAVWCVCAGCLTETRLRMLCPFSPHYRLNSSVPEGK